MATKKKETTAMTNYDAEYAKLAAQYADQEANVGGGQFFSTRGGVLKFNDSPVPNNQMAVVIVDAIMENVFYDSDYDPDAITSPKCYAFGRDENSIQPHEDCEEAQSGGCAACPHNQWGSAEKGRGKACSNRRRLALIDAGQLTKDGAFEPHSDPAAFAKAEIAFLKLPPTSIKGFASYTKQLAKVQKLPPFGVFTLVSLESDPRTQFKLVFEQLDVVPSALQKTIFERHKEARELIEFPYAKVEPATEKPRAAKTRSRKKF